MVMIAFCMTCNWCHRWRHTAKKLFRNELTAKCCSPCDSILTSGCKPEAARSNESMHHSLCRRSTQRYTMLRGTRPAKLLIAILNRFAHDAAHVSCAPECALTVHLEQMTPSACHLQPSHNAVVTASDLATLYVIRLQSGELLSCKQAHICRRAVRTRLIMSHSKLKHLRHRIETRETPFCTG